MLNITYKFHLINLKDIKQDFDNKKMINNRKIFKKIFKKKGNSKSEKDK